MRLGEVAETMMPTFSGIKGSTKLWTRGGTFVSGNLTMDIGGVTVLVLLTVDTVDLIRSYLMKPYGGHGGSAQGKLW